MSDNRINFCTATLMVKPEAWGDDGVQVSYSCEKDGFMVRGCRYFKPMTCAGGLRCYNECEYFENGCTCKRAIAACQKRAMPIISAMLKSVHKTPKRHANK